MITPSFSLTATERVLPKLALDFTTASLDSRVTFTRTDNTATVTNSSGDIASINANLPRFDFDPTTLVCKGLLIEEARTNSLRNNTGVGAVAGTPGTMPTNWGTSTVSGLTREIVGTGTEKGITYIDLKISGTPVSNATYLIVYETTTGVAALQNQTWTLSQYSKIVAGSAANIGVFRYYFQENNIAGSYLTEQNTAFATPTTASLITQRTSASRTLNNALTAFIFFGMNFTVTAGNAIDITLRIGLPQMEQGAFPTSVIPTVATAVTRNADVATMTGTNFSDWYNASEGTIQTQCTLGYTGNFAAFIYPFAINDNSGSNEISMSGAQGSVQMVVSMITSGVQQLNYSFGNWTSGTNKAAIGYKQNNTQLGMNASAKTTDTLCNVPTVNQMAIGRRVVGNFWTGHIQKMNYWPQRLTASELAAFTK